MYDDCGWFSSCSVCVDWQDFTFVCPTEIIAFSERAKQFQELNCQLIAASCDTEETHLAWIKTPRKKGGLGNMQIPILADTTKVCHQCMLAQTTSTFGQVTHRVRFAEHFTNLDIGNTSWPPVLKTPFADHLCLQAFSVLLYPTES